MERVLEQASCSADVLEAIVSSDIFDVYAGISSWTNRPPHLWLEIQLLKLKSSVL
jgi:hypothetical protein